MAAYVWDGFDHYKQAADFNARVGRLQWSSPSTISFTTGRQGGKALQWNSIGPVNGVIQQRVASAFMGAAFAIPSSESLRIGIYDSVANATQVSVVFNVANHSVQIYRGDPSTNLLATTLNNVWASVVYNFIEVWAFIDGSTGFVKVYLNSELLLDTGAVNTKATSNAWWDGVSLNASNIGQISVDDFYYGDTTTGPGAHPCNVPLGDCGTETLFATGNSSVTWTPLSGTNYQMINEVAMDSDTTYNSTATPGDEDLFTFGALTGSIALIYGIQITGAYRKDDVGTRTLKQALKSNVTEIYGSTYSLPDTSYTYITDQIILDPDTGLNWTVSGVNNVLAGYNLVS